MQYHGGNIYKASKIIERTPNEIIDFSSNISLLGLPIEIKEALKNSINSIERYPDPISADLCKSISKYYNVHVKKIVCGNGSDDLIYRIAEALKPDTAIIPFPCFSEYTKSLKDYCSYIDYYRMDYPFLVNDKIINYIKNEDDGGFLVLCNPINPTGSIYSHELLYEIFDVAKRKNIIVLLDESFLDFTEEKSCIDMCEIFPNLIILRSFTKIYATPGLRLGYAICYDEEIIKKIQYSGQEWAVNSLAQVAGITALEKCDNYKKELIQKVKIERKYLFDNLQNLVSEVWNPTANFIFFRDKDTELASKLIEHKILIRNCGSFMGLGSGYYRVAVLNHEKNKKLIDMLKKIKGD